MKTLLTGLLAAAVLAGAGCQDKSAESSSSAPAAATDAATAGTVKPYPLDVCLVSDEKLGSMGDPVVLVHEGQEVKFCCKSCKPDFEKEPAKYLAKLAGR